MKNGSSSEQFGTRKGKTVGRAMQSLHSVLSLAGGRYSHLSDRAQNEAAIAEGHTEIDKVHMNLIFGRLTLEKPFITNETGPLALPSQTMRDTEKETSDALGS